MEDALRESEELVRRVLEACPAPVLMTRVKDGSIVYESPASRALYGDELSGQGHPAATPFR